MKVGDRVLSQSLYMAGVVVRVIGGITQSVQVRWDGDPEPAWYHPNQLVDET